MKKSITLVHQTCKKGIFKHVDGNGYKGNVGNAFLFSVSVVWGYRSVKNCWESKPKKSKISGSYEIGESGGVAGIDARLEVDECRLLERISVLNEVGPQGWDRRSSEDSFHVGRRLGSARGFFPSLLKCIEGIGVEFTLG